MTSQWGQSLSLPFVVLSPSSVMNYEQLRHRRVYNFDQELARHEEQFVPLMEALHRGDPLADAAIAAMDSLPIGEKMALIDGVIEGETQALAEAPAALLRLIEAAEVVPGWVDWNRVERGASVLMRTGILGGITLGAKSLVEGYCAPAGNKPLAMSGRLRDKAAMRLNETARFVEAVGTPEGMRSGQAGFAITLKVRLMHAGVRALIAKSGRWRPELWAVPINQHDMVATIHLFSTTFLEGVESLGMELSPLDREDFLHLWRYVGFVIGVDEHLLPRAMREAKVQWAIISNTQGPPDEDSRQLVMALLEDPLQRATTKEEQALARKHVAFAKALCRAMIGDERADALGLPKDRWSLLVPLVSGAVRSLDKLRRLGFVEPWLERQGRRYWEHTVALGSQGRPIRFELPSALSRR